MSMGRSEKLVQMQEDRRESDHSVAGGSGGGKMPSLWDSYDIYGQYIRPLLTDKILGGTLIYWWGDFSTLWAINPFSNSWKEAHP